MHHLQKPQEETAARLGMNVGALRMALTRQRQRSGAEFRQQVTATVPSRNGRDVDKEIEYLVGLFSDQHRHPLPSM